MIDYSISFCTDKNFEVKEAHDLIESILKNTHCQDIHLVTPDSDWAEDEFNYPHLTIDQRENPIPEHRHSHKLPALSVSDKEYRIFADTRFLFRDSLQPVLEEMSEDILVDQVFFQKWPNEKIWKKWFNHFDLDLPEKRYKAQNDGKEVLMRQSGFIISRDGRNFSECWIDIAKRLLENFPEHFYSDHAVYGYRSGDMYGPLFVLDQIALTIAIEKLNLNDSLLPGAIEIRPSGESEGKIIKKQSRNETYKPRILETPFGYLSWDKEEDKEAMENGSYEDQAYKPFFRNLNEDFKFLDLGAGIGYYSLLADYYGASETVAIDSSKERCRHLRIGERLNQTNWNIRNIELGSEIDLDELGFTPDLVKIDVEGDEKKVFRGGSQTLKKTDRILLETHKLPDKSLEETESLLERFLIKEGFSVERKIDEYRTTNSHWMVSQDGN